MSNTEKRIVFYDGDCGFCNRTVSFILKNDKSGSVFFASLQSEFTIELFKEKGYAKPDLSTFYFLEDDKLYEKSNAAIRLAKYLKFPYNLSRVFKVVPRALRDWIYDGIAKRRQKLMSGFCVMPDPKDRKRFLS